MPSQLAHTHTPPPPPQSATSSTPLPLLPFTCVCVCVCVYVFIVIWWGIVALKKIKINRRRRKRPQKRPFSRAKPCTRPERSKSEESRDGTGSAARKYANACAHVRACETRNPVICYLKVRSSASTAHKHARAPSSLRPLVGSIGRLVARRSLPH